MSMTVKAYLDRGAENQEIRRFAVDQTVSASLAYLKGKIGQVFPSLSDKQYSLYWKDSDNDLVSFSSDDELTEALGFVMDGIFRVYIRPDSADNDTVHKGVVCDSCEKEIRGARYKCITCPDYDLCMCCEQDGKHNQHDMLRICTPRPGGMPFMNFPFMHGPPPHHPPHHGPPHGGPPPHCGPEGEGGPWGPHPWKRFMRRCWRRMMREQWGAPGDFPGGPYGCDKPQGGGQGGQSQGSSQAGSRDSSLDSGRTAQSGDTEGKPEQQGEQGNADCREEYLRNMGDSVAAMLDPLGIDVHVDIEHNGEQKHVHGGARGRRGCRGRGGRGGRGGPMRGNWGMFGGPWGFGGMWGPPPPPPPPPPHHFAQQQQQQQRQEQQSEGDREEDMQQDCGEGSGKQQEMSMGSPSQPGEEGADWTVVGKEQEEEMKSSPPEQPNPDAQVVYPTLPATVPANPGIADALAKMQAMGYTDDGGWLSSLLEAKGGNINAVLDALQPKQ